MDNNTKKIKIINLTRQQYKNFKSNQNNQSSISSQIYNIVDIDELNACSSYIVNVKTPLSTDLSNGTNVEYVETINKNLTTQIKQNLSTISKNTTDINDLSTQISKNKNDINYLSGKVISNDNDITFLSGKIDTNIENINKNKTDINDLSEKVISNDNDITFLSGKIDINKENNTTDITNLKNISQKFVYRYENNEIKNNELILKANYCNVLENFEKNSLKIKFPEYDSDFTIPYVRDCTLFIKNLKDSLEFTFENTNIYIDDEQTFTFEKNKNYLITFSEIKQNTFYISKKEIFEKN